MRKLLGLFALGACLTSIVVAGATAGITVTTTDLGVLSGTFSSSQAMALNDTGQVVGQSDTASGAVHAFSWTAAGGMVDLDTLPSSIFSQALAVNGNGRVAGDYNDRTGGHGAFSWTPSTGMVDIGSLGGTGPYDFTQAKAINAAGEIVGYSAIPEPGFEFNNAFAWTSAGGIVDLGVLGGGTYGQSEAAAVNDSGMVVGSSTPAPGSSGGPQHAFVWTPSGGMVDIQTLSQAVGSDALAVSNTGHVAGDFTDSSGLSHAFSWTASTGMVDLGSLGGTGSVGTQAAAVNDNGEVVGESTIAGPVPYYHAFAWTPAGGMVDLGTLPNSSVSQAVGINDAGEVTGLSFLNNGGVHAFVWTPTTGMVDLGSIAGFGPFYGALAFAINAGGEVAGVSSAANGEHATLWQTADSDLALTNVPANITVDATGPAGATVTYASPTVVDEDAPLPAVGCTPASGSTFAIGTTTVTCTVSAQGDTGSPVSASFTVTVNGSLTQAQALDSYVAGIGPGTSLQAKADAVVADLQAGKTNAACGTLSAMINQANAESGKQLTVDQANTIITDANRIRAVLAC